MPHSVDSKVIELSKQFLTINTQQAQPADKTVVISARAQS